MCACLSLTRGEASSEEHVEEVLRSDVRLEAPVEVEPLAVGVAGAGRLLPSREVILLPLVRVAEHRVCVANLWNSHNDRNVKAKSGGKKLKRTEPPFPIPEKTKFQNLKLIANHSEGKYQPLEGESPFVCVCVYLFDERSHQHARPRVFFLCACVYVYMNKSD